MRPPDQRKWLVRICQGGASAPCHVLRRRHGQGDVGNLEIQILMRYNYCGSEHCATGHVICLGDARVLADRTKHQSTRDTGVDTVECIRVRFILIVRIVGILSKIKQALPRKTSVAEPEIVSTRRVHMLPRIL